MNSSATVVSRLKLFLIGSVFLLTLPHDSYSQDKLFDETLNVLPDSVLLSTSDFEVSEIVHITKGIDDNGFDDNMEGLPCYRQNHCRRCL